jgi:hypothetical protein
VSRPAKAESLSFEYRIIYTIQPEQERLAFTPVQTIFKMDGFFKQEEEETQGSKLTQLLAWMKLSEQRQVDAEQKEQERDETLRKIREEQRAQARKQEDFVMNRPEPSPAASLQVNMNLSPSLVPCFRGLVFAFAIYILALAYAHVAGTF